MNMTQHPNQKESNRAIGKVFSERKLNKIDEK